MLIVKSILEGILVTVLKHGKKHLGPCMFNGFELCLEAQCCKADKP